MPTELKYPRVYNIPPKAFNRGIDTYHAYKFARIIATPWKSLPAYKKGLIDAKGTLLKKPHEMNPSEKELVTPVHIVAFNIKRLIDITPLPLAKKLKYVPYSAAMYMIKEQARETLQMEDCERLEEVFVEQIIAPFDPQYTADASLIRENTDPSPVLPAGVYTVGDFQYVVREELRPSGRSLGHWVFKVGAFNEAYTFEELSHAWTPLTEETPINTSGGVLGQSLVDPPVDLRKYKPNGNRILRRPKKIGLNRS